MPHDGDLQGDDVHAPAAPGVLRRPATRAWRARSATCRARPARRRGPACRWTAGRSRTCRRPARRATRTSHLGQVGTGVRVVPHASTRAKFAAVKFSHATSRVHADGPARAGRVPEVPQAGDGRPSRRAAARRSASRAWRPRAPRATRTSISASSAPRARRATRPASFKVPAYHARQAGRRSSPGKHATQPCTACHKPATAAYPVGRGTAVRYKVGPACASCHTDAHRGSLGTTCETCHTPRRGGAPLAGVPQVEPRSRSKAGTSRVECASCHVNGVIKGTPTRCYDCHWIRRQDDRYQTRLGHGLRDAATGPSAGRRCASITGRSPARR